MTKESIQDFLQNELGIKLDEGEKIEQEGAVPSPGKLQELFGTKSARIRYLYTTHGMSVNEISKYLNIRYQMVRNILTNELKRGPSEPFTLGEKGGLAPLLQKNAPTQEDEDNGEE